MKEAGWGLWLIFALVILAMPVWLVILAGLFAPILFMAFLLAVIWGWLKRQAQPR